MTTLAQSMKKSCALFLIVFLALLSLPTILKAWGPERGAKLEDRRLPYQEWLDEEFQKLMAKSRVQQAQMRQWHSDLARSKRTAAKAAKVRLQNDRKAGGSVP
jgi:hypothetical protein